MKLKKIVQITMISCSMLAVSACAHKRVDDASVSDMSGGSGTQVSGISDSTSFGGGSSRDTSRKRTYYFDYDKFDIHDQDKSAIFANGDYLVAHPNARVTVEGHTDPRGSREYNVALGERRAEAVADLLKSKGVNPSQIRVVSYGAERLASPGHTEGDYQLDRRAVIVYTRN